MNVPREVLRWLQSQELPCIKNPSRDLANGYVVAEILSKKYPSEISTGSFDNGMGLATRSDNWRQIREFVCKKGLLKLDQETVGDIIYYRGDACIGFIVDLYSSMTNKAVSVPRIRTVHAVSTDTPSYARATAAFKLKDSELNRSVDDLERKVKAAGAVLRHEIDNKAMRSKQADEQSGVAQTENNQKREFKPIHTVSDRKPIGVKVISVRAYGNENKIQQPISVQLDSVPDSMDTFGSLIASSIDSVDYNESLVSVCGSILDEASFEHTILGLLQKVEDMDKLTHVTHAVVESFLAGENSIKHRSHLNAFKGRLKSLYEILE